MACTDPQGSHLQAQAALLARKANAGAENWHIIGAHQQQQGPRLVPQLRPQEKTGVGTDPTFRHDAIGRHVANDLHQVVAVIKHQTVPTETAAEGLQQNHVLFRYGITLHIVAGQRRPSPGPPASIRAQGRHGAAGHLATAPIDAVGGIGHGKALVAVAQGLGFTQKQQSAGQ